MFPRTLISIACFGVLLLAAPAEAGVADKTFDTNVQTGAPGGSDFCFQFLGNGVLQTTGLGSGTWTEFDLFILSFFSFDLDTGTQGSGTGISLFNIWIFGGFTDGPSFFGFDSNTCAPDPAPAR